MQGYNVLFPIGYDAFGLPTENYAVQHHIHPAKVTHDNIENFRKQLHMLGYSFDWDREVNTTDPSYYKWTQWIFLQMFKKGLAYKASMPVNWCTSCKIVLANEEVVDGVCERCGGQVIRKEKSQWMLAITKYADRLIDDLDDLDFIERVKIQQKNWIGRSDRRGGELHRPPPATSIDGLHHPAATPCSAPPIWCSPRSTPYLAAVEGRGSQNCADAVAALSEGRRPQVRL